MYQIYKQFFFIFVQSFDLSMYRLSGSLAVILTTNKTRFSIKVKIYFGLIVHMLNKLFLNYFAACDFRVM